MPHKGDSKVQAFLFDKNQFNPEQVKEWIKDHEYSLKKSIHETEGYLRARIMNPNEKKYDYRTIDISKGIKGIIQFPKKGLKEKVKEKTKQGIKKGAKKSGELALKGVEKGAELTGRGLVIGAKLGYKGTKAATKGLVKGVVKQVKSELKK